MEIDYVTRAPYGDYYHVHLRNGDVFGYVPPRAMDVCDSCPPGGGAVTFQQAMGQGLLFHGRRQATLQAQLAWMEWVLAPEGGPCPAYVVHDALGPILVVRGYETLSA